MEYITQSPKARAARLAIMVAIDFWQDAEHECPQFEQAMRWNIARCCERYKAYILSAARDAGANFCRNAEIFEPCLEMFADTKFVWARGLSGDGLRQSFNEWILDYEHTLEEDTCRCVCEGCECEGEGSCGNDDCDGDGCLCCNRHCGCLGGAKFEVANIRKLIRHWNEALVKRDRAHEVVLFRRIAAYISTLKSVPRFGNEFWAEVCLYYDILVGGEDSDEELQEMIDSIEF
jgi:hypothetical protein